MNPEKTTEFVRGTNPYTVRGQYIDLGKAMTGIHDWPLTVAMPAEWRPLGWTLEMMESRHDQHMVMFMAFIEKPLIAKRSESSLKLRVKAYA